MDFEMGYDPKIIVLMSVPKYTNGEKATTYVVIHYCNSKNMMTKMQHVFDIHDRQEMTKSVDPQQAA